MNVIKKISKIFLGLVMIMPLIVDAFSYTSYTNSITNTNNYINKYSDANKFLVFNLPYGFANKVPTTASGFSKGGMLSKEEFEISRINNSSYLATGREYWTLSGKSSTEQYYVDNNLLNKNVNNSSGTRVTEYVKRTVNVDGTGTYVNPWVFKNQFSVDLKVNSKNYGEVAIDENKTKTSAMVDSGTKLEFKVYPKTGYMYVNSDCSLTLKSASVGEDGNDIMKLETKPITKDTKCILNFDVKVVTVTFDCDGGTNAPAKVECVYGKNCSIPDYNICKKTGFNQVKWVTSSGFEWTPGEYTNFRYANGERGISQNKLLLKAVWDSKNYTLNLNKGNGTTDGTTSIQTKYNVSTITPSTITLAKKEYSVSGFGLDASRKSNNATVSSSSTLTSRATLNGYYTASSGGNKILNASSTASFVNTNVSGYLNGGKWIKDGGETLYAQYGSLPSVKLPTITKGGYTCGWSTSSSATTISYLSGANYTPTSNTTMYGVCVPEKYTVEFDPNGGIGGQSANVQATFGENMPSISKTAPEKTEYVFQGWYDDETFINGTQYYKADGTSARTYNKIGGTKLYAGWLLKKYTIKFHANGGSGGQTNNESVAKGETMPTINTTKPSKTGYTFMGWYDNADYTKGIQYYKADCTSTKKYDKSSDITLYAGWKVKTYTVSFNCNNGSGAPANQTATYGKPFTLTSSTCTRSGYNQNGWNEKSDGTGIAWTTSNTNNWTWNRDGNVTLYAVWGKKEITTTKTWSSQGKVNWKGTQFPFNVKFSGTFTRKADGKVYVTYTVSGDCDAPSPTNYVVGNFYIGSYHKSINGETYNTNESWFSASDQSVGTYNYGDTITIKWVPTNNGLNSWDTAVNDSVTLN